jgi:tetratricopeptide (TPR) repeat protein
VSEASTHSGEILDLTALLQNLADTRRTGTLILRGAEGRRLFLYLREGVLAAAFDGNEESLATSFVKTRAMTLAGLSEFREFFQPTAATLDRLVVEQGKVTPDQLLEARTFMIRELVCDALTWPSPRTELRDGPPLPELVRVNLPHEGVQVSIRPLLMTAVYQLDEWRRIRALVPSERDVPLRTSEGFPADEARAELLALVDGRRTVGELLAIAPLSRFQACSLLRDAVEAGEVRMRSQAELLALAAELLPGAERSDATRDLLVEIYERCEELGLDDPTVSLWLAEAQEARGELTKASRRYLQAGRELAKRSQRGSTRAFRRALELLPDDGSLQRELVEKLLAQGRLEEAAMQTEVFVSWLRRRGDPFATLRATRDLLEQLEEFEEMLVLQAEIHAEAGDRMEALHLYQRIAGVRLDGDLAEDFELEEKVDVLERILQLDPNAQDARFRLGQLLIESDPERAADELELFLDRAKTDQGGSADPRLVEAIDQLERLSPNRQRTAQRVHAYLDCAQVDRAASALEKALANPERDKAELLSAYERLHAVRKSPASHALLAQALVEAGLASRGVAELQALARSQRDDGEDEAALTTLRLALSYDPFDWVSRGALVELLEEEDPAWRENVRALADIARIRGDRDLAIDTLALYLRAVPSDLAARLELAQAVVDRGEEGALEVLAELATRCAQTGDRGILTWIRAQATALGAEQAWLETLPSPGAKS